MPDVQRQGDASTQTYTLGDRRFVGIDTNLPPNQLDVGVLQDVENLYVDGFALTCRPGWRAQLASTLANPIYALTPYRTADNVVNRMFFVSGSYVYWMAVNASSTTQIATAGTWTDASKVRLKQHGKYIYGVPGDDGTAMFRIDGSLTTPTLETIPQLSAPTVNGVDYVKPTATVTPIKAKTIGTQVRTVYASIPSASSTFTADNSYSSNDTVTVATSIGTSFTAGTTYYVRNQTSTTFQLSASSGGAAISNGSGAAANVYVVKIDNQIDDYYTYAGFGANSKPSVTDWPTVWSGNLFKNSTGATTVPSGDFDGYADDSQFSGGPSANMRTDFTGSGASVKQLYSDTANTTAVFNWAKNNALKIKKYQSWTAYTSPSALSIKAMLCDNPGEYFEQSIQALPQETISPSSTATTMGLYVCQFFAFPNISNTDPPIKFIFLAQGVDNDGNDIPGATVSQTYLMSAVSSEADWQRKDVIIDMRQFASGLKRIRIRFTSAATKSGQQLFFARIKLFALSNHMTASLEKTVSTDINGLNIVRSFQANTNINPAFSTYLDNRRIRIYSNDDSSVSLNLKPANAISFQWYWDSALRRPDGSYPLVTCGLGNGTTINWSSIGEYDADNRYMTFNLFEMSESEKSNIDYLYIKFENDVLLYKADDPNGTVGVHGTPLFGIGNMVFDTGLTNGSRYEYAFTRWYPSSASAVPPYTQLADGTFAKGFETDLSDVSDPVYTTSALAGTTVIINPTNSAGYGSNICIDKLRLAIATDTSDQDQWVSVKVPGASQITLVTTETSSPSITYMPISGTSTTVSGGSWVTASAPDGTTYKKYTIPANDANRLKYVTAFGGTGTYWLEHYVPYGYSTSSKYSHICVYRRNSTIFPDGRFRLIAVVPVSDTGSGSATGSGWSSSYDNSTSRQITFIDKVPDGNILYQTTPYAQGWYYEIARDNMPLGGTCLSVFQNRLWVGKKNQVFASWTIDQTDEYKIYTSILPDLNEPGVQKKGFTFSLGGTQEKEIIQALLPVYSENIVQSNTTTAIMLVLKENSVSTVIGFDPTSFNVQLWVSSPGVGIAAPLTALNANGQMTWLGVNGLVQWNGGGVVPRSTQLRKLISLDPTQQGAPNIDKDQYRKSISAVANNRLYLLSTSSSAGAANQTVYVFDALANGWVKWKTINSVEYTSLATLSFGDDVQYLYAGSTTGQIYKLDGTADLATTAGSDTEIAWSLKTRQHGQAYAEGPSYYQYNRPYQLDIHVQNVSATPAVGTSLPVTWYLENQSGPYNVTTAPDGVSVSSTYSFPQNTNRAVAIRNLGRDVKGPTIQVRLTGTTKGVFFIRGIHVHMYEGGIRR